MLALVLAELLLHLGLDLRADLGLRPGLADALHEEADAGDDVGLAEELDLVLGREVDERGDAIGEAARVLLVEIERGEGAAGVTDQLADLGSKRARELLGLDRVGAGLGEMRDLRLVEAGRCRRACRGARGRGLRARARTRARCGGSPT